MQNRGKTFILVWIQEFQKKLLIIYATDAAMENKVCNDFVIIPKFTKWFGIMNTSFTSAQSLDDQEIKTCGQTTYLCICNCIVGDISFIY